MISLLILKDVKTKNWVGEKRSKGPCENVLLMVLGEMNSLDYISSFNAVPGLNILSCSAVGNIGSYSFG